MSSTRRRCYTCKCLDAESPIKFYERTKDNPKARFYCKKCDPVRKKSIEKMLKKSANIREMKRFEKLLKPQVEIEDSKRKDKSNKFNKTEAGIKARRRYSNTDKGKATESIRTYNYRIRQMGKDTLFHGMSDEEKIAIGRFYRKCPEGCQIDHIIPLSKGGRHELSNLQYLSKEEHLKKTAKERTKKAKTEIYEMYPFTPMPEANQEIDFSEKIRHRQSKFKRVRLLVKN